MPTSAAPNPRYDAASKTVFVAFNKTPAKPVPSGAIAEVKVPATGETPVTTVKATDYYTGTVQWIGDMDDGKFDGGKPYTAVITLEAKDGYDFSGVTNGSGATGTYFTVASASTVTTVAGSGVVTAVFTGPTTPKIAKAIAGVTAPVLGAAPVTTTSGTGYTATVEWSDNPVTFAAGKAYTATINITLTTGVTLAGVGANYGFTLTGAPDGTTVTNPAVTSTSATTLAVTAVFPRLPEVVTIKAFALATPVAGANKVEKIDATDQFESDGNILWNGVSATGQYDGETIYKAEIKIKPKSGFTLVGIPTSTSTTGTGSSFFVLTPAGPTGTTTTYTAADSTGSGVITVTFPKTASKTIDITLINGLTPPALSPAAKGVTTITASAQYEGAVTWTRKASANFSPDWDGVNDNFVPGIYTATIVLHAKPTFTTSGLTASGNPTADKPSPSVFKINGAPSGTVVTNVAPVAGTGTDGTVGSGNAQAGGNFKDITITVVFPVLSTAIPFEVIPGISVPSAAATMPTTITPNTKYTGTVTWREGDGVVAGSAFTGNPTAGNKYTAVIVLVPVTDSGYTLNGIPAGNGTSTGFQIGTTYGTNAANSGTITVVCTAGS